MASLVESAKKAFTVATSTDKIADLQRDTQETRPGEHLTTDHGVKVSDTDNWCVGYKSVSACWLTRVSTRLRVIGSSGEYNGPMLLEDQIGREKIHRFDHERIPERVVHARGAAAHGYFKLYDNRASKYTYAPVLTDSSRTTPVFVRFSTVQGARGSAVRTLISILLTFIGVLLRRILSATFEGLRLNSTHKRAIGTSLGMTSLFFSFKMPSNSRILSTL